MPVVERPKHVVPLFGDGAQVLMGPGLVQVLREKVRRDREAGPSAPADKCLDR